MGEEKEKSKGVNFDVSLIKVECNEAATAFINRISDAVGGLARPWQIERVAKAEANAAITKATAGIEIDHLQRRALMRFANEQAQQQIAMETVAAKAAPLITEAAKPEIVAHDWITDFFQKCRHVTDTEMQSLWAKILAGEANVPGSYSRRTLAILDSLDKRDAEVFKNLCRFNWKLPMNMPIITDFDAEIYTSNKIRFDELQNLAAIGLVSLNGVAAYRIKPHHSVLFARYCDAAFQIQSLTYSPHHFPIGRVLLTQAGQELSNIVSTEPVLNFPHHVSGYWAQAGWQTTSAAERSIIIEVGLDYADIHPDQIDGGVWS